VEVTFREITYYIQCYLEDVSELEYALGMHYKRKVELFSELVQEIETSLIPAAVVVG